MSLLSSSLLYVIVLQHSLSYLVQKINIQTDSTAAASERSGRSMKNMKSSNKQEIEETEIYCHAKICTFFKDEGWLEWAEYHQDYAGYLIQEWYSDQLLDNSWKLSNRLQ